MIDKARYIFDRWSNGQELPTIVLRHITDENDSSESPKLQGSTIELTNPNQYSRHYTPVASQTPTSDSFVKSHQSLTQCIVEVHERAKALFPLRKPCQCSAKISQSCPPSHSWSPVPNMATSQTSPVLPPDAIPFPTNAPRMSPVPNSFSAIAASMDMSTPRYPSPRQATGRPSGYFGTPSNSGEGFYSNTILPSGGPAIPPLPLTSKMAVVDTLNFELGALQANSDQNWMAFF